MPLHQLYSWGMYIIYELEPSLHLPQEGYGEIIWIYL